MLFRQRLGKVVHAGRRTPQGAAGYSQSGP